MLVGGTNNKRYKSLKLPPRFFVAAPSAQEHFHRGWCHLVFPANAGKNLPWICMDRNWNNPYHPCMAYLHIFTYSLSLNIPYMDPMGNINVWIFQGGEGLLTSTLGRPEWRRWLSSTMECPPGTLSRCWWHVFHVCRWFGPWCLRCSKPCFDDFNVTVLVGGQERKQQKKELITSHWLHGCFLSNKRPWTTAHARHLGNFLENPSFCQASQEHINPWPGSYLHFLGGNWFAKRREEKLFLHFPRSQNLRHFCKASCLPAP